MAVYFDQRLETDLTAIKTDIAWHKIFQQLATAVYVEDQGGSVQIFQEEGERVQGPTIQKSFQVTSLEWHPTKKILAVGWESGELLIWNGVEMELMESAPLHKSAVTVLGWSSNGTRLTSADKAGNIIVWKADSRGRLQQIPICQHAVQEPLSKIVFKPPPPSDSTTDITQLARAAVSGDESALDMFNWKKGKSGVKISSALGSSEALAFFVAGASGGVYYVNEDGKCIQCFCVDTSVKTLLYYREKDILVTITDNLMLTQHNVLPEGDVNEILKVKLSGRSEEANIVWAGKGILATATGENVLRMWDMNMEENYVLSLDGHSGYDPNEGILCVAFCESKGLLAAGTNMGNIAMWKYSFPLTPGLKKIEGENKWKLQSPSTVEGPVRQLLWGSSKNMLCANTFNNIFMLSEQLMNASFHGETSVIQVGPSNLIIDMFETGNHHELKTDMQIKGVYTTKEALAVWNGKKVNVYEYSEDKSVIRAVGAFATESMHLTIYDQNIYTVEPGKVQVRTFQGTVKQLLACSEVEGQPIDIDICGNFLVIATSNGYLKIYDLSRREAKAHSNPKNVGELIQGFGSIQTARCNCSGSRVSIQVNKTDGVPDPKLYFWDLELDSVQYFNFETGRGEQDDYPSTTEDGEDGSEDLNDQERGKNQAAKDIAGRYPISHTWDPHEPKLIVCQGSLLPNKDKEEKEDVKKTPSLMKPVLDTPIEVMVVSLFSSVDNGLLIQDSYPLDDVFNTLLAVQVPYHYFLRKSEDTSEEPPPPVKSDSIYSVIEKSTPFFPKMVSRKVMRDFVGLERSDKNTRDAMMNFSFYLAVGNMDEAFKAIKLIKSESVWENMAKMCVKSRRLDVASVCLGNMGHARGAKALREAQKEPELDARVAMLAIQLGLNDDAERLLKNCKRYDLLNRFYQSMSQWGKAMETAEMYDRIHLRSTYYNYAKHLEAKGDANQAIPNYEKSDTHRFEVPRMLFDEPDILESYIMKSRDMTLRKWWAQYLESTGDMDAALQFYEAAQDYLSLVRVYCYCGTMDKAADVCNETGDKAACYHLARQYENNDLIKEAIHFFTRAQAYGNAIRLCMEHGYEDQILNLALLGRSDDMMDAARYFEQRSGMEDKAVMLFHKAGNFAKALDLAFKSKQFGALQMISADLDERADPALLQRCADFFLDNGQYDKAVDLLGLGRKYWDALKICMEHHVIMTEELAERMTPEKGEGENDVLERNRILEGIAEVSMHQGQYHIATKKFTQAGNKLKAMKSLLKSGDTEKIVFFAGVSRQKEIYVMAANYLQSLDWRREPEIMKNIINFYTKGRALDSLAGFYDACAMVEIDEYQNYEKALGALGEAYKSMSKAKMANESLQEEKLGIIKHKMTLIKKFVMARRSYEEDSEEAVRQCQVLLEEPGVDACVRIGDLIGFVVEHYARKEKWKVFFEEIKENASRELMAIPKEGFANCFNSGSNTGKSPKAYNYLEELRNKMPSGNLTYYVDMRTVEAIHQALDLPVGRGFLVNNNKLNGYRGSPEEEDGEEVEEEVVDEQ